jgi:hypothetical protein
MLLARFSSVRVFSGSFLGMADIAYTFCDYQFYRSWLIMKMIPVSRRTKMSLLSIGLVIFSLVSISWTSEYFDFSQKGNPMTTKRIEVVLKEHTQAIMSIPGVVGVGQGLCEGKPCVKVFVIKKTLDLDQKIPDTLDGYPVMVEETGEIEALPRSQDP